MNKMVKKIVSFTAAGIMLASTAAIGANAAKGTEYCNGTSRSANKVKNTIGHLPTYVGSVNKPREYAGEDTYLGDYSGAYNYGYVASSTLGQGVTYAHYARIVSGGKFKESKVSYKKYMAVSTGNVKLKNSARFEGYFIV